MKIMLNAVVSTIVEFYNVPS